MAAAATAPAPTYGADGQTVETPGWRANLNTHMICPDCRTNPPDLIEENAEIICQNCGMVLADRVQSYESEWRTFNSDESRGDDPNRVGEAENELLNGDQLTTQIGGSGAVSKETRKLQRAQGTLTAEKSNKALQAAYRQIDLWADKAELTTAVRQAAKQFYKDADDKKAFKTKSQDAVLAGCLFIACRQLKQPRSFAEIFGLTSVPKKEIGRVYKALESFLTDNAKDKINKIEAQGGVVNHQVAAYESTQSAKAFDLCERYCNMLGLKFRTETISKKLAEKIPGISNLAGRSPLSNAAACIYFASHLLGQGASIKNISEIANVSDATIKHAYKFLLAEKNAVVDPTWLGLNLAELLVLWQTCLRRRTAVVTSPSEAMCVSKAVIGGWTEGDISNQQVKTYTILSKRPKREVVSLSTTTPAMTVQIGDTTLAAVVCLILMEIKLHITKHSDGVFELG